MGGGPNCHGCEKCQTTFAEHPDYHQPLEPHTWITRYNEITGKPYKICERCSERDEESYNESKIT